MQLSYFDREPIHVCGQTLSDTFHIHVMTLSKYPIPTVIIGERFVTEIDSFRSILVSLPNFELIDTRVEPVVKYP